MSLQNRCTGSSLRKCINEDRDKVYDMKKLEDMVNTIDDYQSKKIDLKRCLVDLGNLASGISFNDNKNGVRNQYGYIKKDSKKINKNGIFFEKLSQITKIVSNEKLFSSIPETEFEPLIGDLCILKKKVMFVLKKESSNSENWDMSLDVQPDSMKPISYIVNFSERYFDIFTSGLLNNEINDWEAIEESQQRPTDFKEKDDRYFFARLFCKIGESLNELIKGKSIEERDATTEAMVIKSFKNIVIIRNKIIHNHKIISSGITDGNENINYSITAMKKHMKEVFSKPTGASDQLTINYHYENADIFAESSKRLLLYLRAESVDIRKTLDGLIIEAYHILRELENITEEKLIKEDSCKKSKNKLKNVNKKYQSHIARVSNNAHLCQLNDSHMVDYPSALNMENRSAIVKLYEILSQESSGHQKNLKECDEGSKNVLEDLTDKEKLVIEVKKIFQLENKKKGIEDIERIESSLNDNIQLIDEEVKYYQFIMDKSFNQKIDLINDSLTRGEALIFMQDLEYEMDETSFLTGTTDRNVFLTTMEMYINRLYPFLYDRSDTKTLRFSEMKKYEYIIKHIILIINQLLISSEQIISREAGKNSLPKEEDKRCISRYFHKYATSLIIKEGRKLCKGTRSKGLAHNLDCCDRGNLYSSIIDTLNMFDHMDSLNCIIKRDESSSLSTLYKISSSFLKMNLYEDALEFLNKVIQRVESHPNEASEDLSGHEYEEVIGKTRFVYAINKLIVLSYLSSFQNDLAYERLMDMIKRIDNERLNKCVNDEVLNEVSFLYCSVGHYFLHIKEDYNQALLYLEQANSISECLLTKVVLAKVYFGMKKYDECREMCKYILHRSTRSIIKISAFKVLIDCDSVFPNRPDLLPEMRNCIDQMVQIYKTDIQYFKEIYRDNYLTLGMHILIYKLYLIFVEVRHQSMNESILNILVEVESEFLNIKSKINEEELSDRELGLFYFLACRNFCYVHITGDFNLDKDGKYLKIARKYFNNYLNMLKLLNPEEENSILSHKKLQRAAYDLVIAYNNFVNRNSVYLDIKARIRYLVEALQIAVDHNVGRADTYRNLGMHFFRLAESYDELIKEKRYRHYSDFILEYYNDTIKYFELAIEELTDEDDSDSEINDSKIYVALSTLALARLKCDLRLLRNSLSYSNEILNVPHFNTKKESLRKETSNLNELFINIVAILKEILKPGDNCIKITEYTIKYCLERWDIEISDKNGKLEWKYLGDLAVEELKSNISIELQCIEE